MYALIHLQAQSGTWYWAVNFTRRGQVHYRRFYEPKYGGSAKAKKAAIAWRDEQMAQIPPLSIVEFCQQKRNNNTSGVPGVHFLTTPAQPHGIWQARLKLDGKAKHKSFSVLKHGYQQAYDMAVAARAQLLAEADDRLYLYDTLAKRVAAKAASARTEPANAKTPLHPA